MWSCSTVLLSICTSSLWSFRPVGAVQQPAMGLFPTANQQGKLLRGEWMRLSSRAIAPRDGRAGTVHPCHVLVWEKVIPMKNEILPFFVKRASVCTIVNFCLKRSLMYYLRCFRWLHQFSFYNNKEICSGSFTEAGKLES